MCRGYNSVRTALESHVNWATNTLSGCKNFTVNYFLLVQVVPVVSEVLIYLVQETRGTFPHYVNTPM